MQLLRDMTTLKPRSAAFSGPSSSRVLFFPPQSIFLFYLFLISLLYFISGNARGTCTAFFLAVPLAHSPLGNQFLLFLFSPFHLYLFPFFVSTSFFFFKKK
uniref:Uncharacterized protein n=1 Tax=Trypanosoma congolense (strain IL3000) TaxID=1068625 RepID=G0UMF1_TRYCI|nr:hypothetical protein, unlikely [Trypanosoma congolense IL3000]